MATVAVGDIHGNLPALTDLLDRIRPEIGDGDTVVFLGDYIDRGPASKGCIDAILGFEREVRARVMNNATLNAKGWPSPTALGQTIGIDTIAHGVLTAIRLPDRRVFQSARYESR
jgi:hypothetical protein